MFLGLCQAGAVTTSSGSLFQCPNTLWVKKFLLICNLTFPDSAWSCFLGCCHWSPEWRDWSLPLLFPSWECWRPQWDFHKETQVSSRLWLHSASFVVNFHFPCDTVNSWLFTSNPDATFEKSAFGGCKVCSNKRVLYCIPLMLNSICLSPYWLALQVGDLCQGKSCWSPQLLLCYSCSLPAVKACNTNL